MDGLSPLKKKKKNKYMYFFYFLISINKGPRRFWALAFEKPLEKQKNWPIFFKYRHYRWFLENKKNIFYLYILFMIF